MYLITEEEEEEEAMEEEVAVVAEERHHQNYCEVTAAEGEAFEEASEEAIARQWAAVVGE